MHKIKLLGLQQNEAAARCGFNPNYFNKTIKGVRPMSAPEALKISKGLGISLHEVITGDQEEDLASEVKEIKALLKRMQEREFTKNSPTRPHSIKHDPTNQPV